jgi:tRNA A37 threonylcarbamoyltransferase TsaD
MQETVFAMLVETAERALAHTGKKELLLGGGVACNSRLQEMCKVMCEERGARCFVPERGLLVDNGAMIAFLGEIMFRKGLGEKNIEKIDIMPRQRTDDVIVSWK